MIFGGIFVKKIIGVFLVALFALSMVACGSSSNVSRSDLIGDWYTEEDDGIVQNITLTEDGKYLSETISPMGFSLVSENIWSYEDGVFTVNYIEYGTTSVYKKVTLEGNTLTLDNGVGKIVYTRK